MQVGGDVDLFHEAVMEDDAIEAIADLLRFAAVGGIDVGYAFHLYGQNDDALVHNLVMLQIVK